MIDSKSKSEDARDPAAEILEEIGTRQGLHVLQKSVVEVPDHFTMRSIGVS